MKVHCYRTSLFRESLLTNVFVDAVDSLDVPGHGLDARLLAPHFGVEEVVRLEVEHAGRLPRVDGIAPLLLLLPPAPPVFRSVVGLASVPARVQSAINQLILIQQQG